MTEFELVAAIKLLKPTAEFSFSETDYSTIQWQVLDGDAPTWSQIESAHLELEKIEQEKITREEAKRAAALAKLEAIGLDEDDLKALGL